MMMAPAVGGGAGRTSSAQPRPSRILSLLLLVAAVAVSGAGAAPVATALDAVVSILGSMNLVTQQAQLLLLGLAMPKGSIRDYKIEALVSEGLHFIAAGGSQPCWWSRTAQRCGFGWAALGESRLQTAAIGGDASEVAR